MLRGPAQSENGHRKQAGEAPARAAEARPGQSLFHYEVMYLLGRGAASNVYAVVDPESRHCYALKHIEVRGGKSQRILEQVRREYEVCQCVSHAGLRRSVALHEQRSWLGSVRAAGLVLEFVDGTMPRPTPRDGAGMLPALLQLAEALDAIHACGYAHCDVKPQNLLLDKHGRLRLIDFGQACEVGTIKPRVQGTPDYIAPEQVRSRPVHPKMDVYGWGATAYYLLCGHVAPTLMTLKRSSNSFLLDTAMTTVQEHGGCVSEQISDLVMSCLRTVPEKRPEMSEVIGVLRAICQANVATLAGEATEPPAIRDGDDRFTAEAEDERFTQPLSD